MRHSQTTTPPNDSAFLDRYLAGECTAEEEAALDRRAAADPRLAAELEAVTRTVQEAGRRNGLPEAEVAWEAFRARKAEPGIRRRTAGPKTQTWFGRVLAISAACALILLAVIRSQMTTLPKQSAVRSYVTAAGQRATVTLSDGTRAVLGPASRLEVTTDENSHDAIVVTVVGQALFTVAHDTRTPFIVRAGHSVTRVLGTTFLVRHYETDGATRLFVTDGRVTVQSVRGTSAITAPTVLAAHMLGVVSDSGHVRVTTDVVAEDYTAWTLGTLVFKGALVSDIVAELNRVYDTDIRLADSVLAKRRLTWTIHTSRSSLADVLDELPLVLDTRVVQDGKVIMLLPGRRASKKTLPSRSSPLQELQYGR